MLPRGKYRLKRLDAQNVVFLCHLCDLLLLEFNVLTSSFSLMSVSYSSRFFKSFTGDQVLHTSMNEGIGLCRKTSLEETKLSLRGHCFYSTALQNYLLSNLLRDVTKVLTTNITSQQLLFYLRFLLFRMILAYLWCVLP